MDDAELIQRYLAYHRTGADEDFDGFDAAADLLSRDPARLWRITVGLLHACENDAELAYVAAGPLEELVCRHPALWPEIEAAARKDAVVLRALRGVWGRPRMAPQVREALERLLAERPLRPV